MKNIVTIGGGSGQSQVLKALKDIPDIRITGICPSTDSGGSTGVLRDIYDGNGYVGDVTKCIATLSSDPILADALTYRFNEGPLHGHSVKNLLFHALEQVSDTESALLTLWQLCGLRLHRVLPVTMEKTELVVALSMGNVISGETYIDTIAQNPLWDARLHSITDVYLEPRVHASRFAVDAVTDADVIVISPGDLYSSIIPVLLPDGMKEAMVASRASIIIVLNIMTKKGETDNYTTIDFVERIEPHVGREATYVVYNTAPIPDHVLARYSLEQKVEREMFEDSESPRFVGAPLARISESQKVYTDPQELGKVISSLL